MTQPIKYQGVDKQSSGYKLLAAMGWQEGSGLGARQQGIKEHVKVKKKHDSTGVGAVEAIAKARDWTAGMAAYDLVLAKMKSVGAASLPAKVSSKASKEKRKQPEPDAAPASATAQQQATEPLTDTPISKKDKKRKKAKASAAASTETYTESPLQETVLPIAGVQVTSVQEPAPAQRARNRHVGRYHKTAAAKKAGSYSKSDLAAILGVDSFPTAAPVSVTAVAQSSEEQELSEDTTFEPQDAAAGPSAWSESQSAQPVEVEEEAPEPQDGSLWWHGMFIRAGRMGNMASDVRPDGQEQGKKVQINGFSEQDQENLYMATQAGKSAGKKGLGKSSQGKTIGGAKWEGTKTAFDIDEDTTGAAAAEPAAAIADADVREAAEAPSGAKLRWKKKAKRAILAAGGKMKLKKLQKQLLQDCCLPKVEQTQALNDMTTQLTDSKQFRVAGSSIALVE
ncbi:TPA: hypothetical protein ACH3X1_004065 [Trebouxia sp. C0004]